MPECLGKRELWMEADGEFPGSNTSKTTPKINLFVIFYLRNLRNLWINFSSVDDIRKARRMVFFTTAC